MTLCKTVVCQNPKCGLELVTQVLAPGAGAKICKCGNLLWPNSVVDISWLPEQDASVPERPYPDASVAQLLYWPGGIPEALV